MAALRVLAWILGIFMLVLLIGFTVRGVGSFFSGRSDVSDASVSRARGTAHPSESELQRDFQNALVRRALETTGQPIGGFDAYTLMCAFPGLRAEDFRGVAALGGYYSSTGGEVIFERETDRRTSTAEQALSIEGYDLLLENLMGRYGVLVDQESIDELIERLERDEAELLDEEIEVKLYERATARDVSITPHALLMEEGRCPGFVKCIAPPVLRVSVSLKDSFHEETKVLTLNEPFSMGSRTVTLVEVSPEPLEPNGVDATDFLLTFHITNSNCGAVLRDTVEVGSY